MGFNHTCLVIISLDSALKKDENYYPQGFLKECKYIEKERKVITHITDGFFYYSSWFFPNDEKQIKGKYQDILF